MLRLQTAVRVVFLGVETRIVRTHELAYTCQM